MRSGESDPETPKIVAQERWLVPPSGKEIT
jgi:hypothetical protein